MTVKHDQWKQTSLFNNTLGLLWYKDNTEIIKSFMIESAGSVNKQFSYDLLWIAAFWAHYLYLLVTLSHRLFHDKSSLSLHCTGTNPPPSLFERALRLEVFSIFFLIVASSGLLRNTLVQIVSNFWHKMKLFTECSVYLTLFGNQTRAFHIGKLCRKEALFGKLW